MKGRTGIMENLRNLERQHREIIVTIGEISSLIERDFISKTAELRDLLATLAGKLKMHLAVENQALYPELLNGADPAVKSIAQKFWTEMGNLQKSLEEYLRKWPVPESIANAPEAFIIETTQLLSVLTQRILREDQELYPLLR